MNLRIPVSLAHTLHSFSAIKSVALWIALAMTAQVLAAKPAPHVPKSIVSDWTQRHVLYPDSKNESVLAQYREDPRWELSWYLRHREAWWPEFHPAASAPVGEDPWEESHIVRRELFLPEETVKRDWNIALGTATFLPIIDYSFIISTQTAYGSLNVTDLGGGSWLATAGNLTVTGGSDVGTYSLIPGGPGVTLSPLGSFDYNDVIYPSANPALDVDGLLFGDSVKEINVWGTGTNSYSFYDSTAPQVYGTQLNATGTFSFQPAPGAGEGFPAKYVFDVTATPSCSSDFVAI
jgi:hypothetical protein